ncbi:MAG: hypothetical protein F4018_09525 [Acidobacteria bacterium]|nr:hypothetical protein [Acidobacteriota bacterium]MYK88553.1 hypothetical protein [Acidobacteriota bacterium]
MTRIALVLVLVAVTTTPSLAQDQTATSFDRLWLLVNQGDRITVTDRAGQELQGRIVGLSPSTLSVQVNGVRHDLQEAEVSIIRRRQRDSLKNGALLGFMSGAALMASQMQGVHPGAKLMLSSLYGAAGAAIGAGVDALIKDSAVIYRTRHSTRRFSVSPLLSRDRRGLSLSVGF